MELVKVSDIFELKYGSNLELINLTQCKSTDKNAIPFVSRTRENNGVSAFVKKIEVSPNPAHTLSVAVSGSVLSTFYQPVEYYSGRDVYYLTPKVKLDVIEMLYYAKVISINKYKYSYGRQANKTLKDILIPKITPNLKIKLNNLYKKILTKIKTEPLINKKITLDTSTWKEFKLSELFEIKGTKTTPLIELESLGKGKYPYVTTQATNNAVAGFYDYYTEDGNVITIDSAVIGYTSYQALPFSASDHVEKLIPKFNLNPFIAMFLVTILNKEQYRFSYGRKASQSRLKDLKIKLPTKNNEPDWKFMEEFIKSLPYSVNLKLKTD